MPGPTKTPVSMALSSPGPMKEDVPVTVRKRFIVKGRVQRVGYRAMVLAFADVNNLKGYARNLPDRTVEIVCEGTPAAIGAFLKAIDRKGDPQDPLSINVASIEEALPAPEGALQEFYIDYGRELTPVERESMDRDEIMILGAGILNVKVDGVGQKVDSMRSDMNTRFDDMAQRYDLIATSLVKAIDRLDAGFERMDKNSKQTDKAIEQSRKEAAAANRELAKAVKFMIRKLSGRPAQKRRAGKLKR